MSGPSPSSPGEAARILEVPNPSQAIDSDLSNTRADNTPRSAGTEVRALRSGPVAYYFKVTAMRSTSAFSAGT